MKKATLPKIPAGFSDAIDSLAGIGDIGIAALMDSAEAARFVEVPLDLIDVDAEQVRAEFEDVDSTLADLADSIRARGVLQPILVRPLSNGRYRLVAGERRLRASRLAELTRIPAYVRSMTDDEAEDAQLAENVQRKNLTQMEEARRLQRDLERLGGDREALAAKHAKSLAWISDRLKYLNRGPVADRLVRENVTADIQAINQVSRIESVDPERAAATVEALKARSPEQTVRDIVDTAAKDAGLKRDYRKASAPKRAPAPIHQDESGPVAAAAPVPAVGAIHHDELPAAAAVPAEPSNTVSSVESAFDAVWESMISGVSAAAAVATLDGDDRSALEDDLRAEHAAGVDATDVSAAVLAGMRAGRYGAHRCGAIRLASFLAGVTGQDFAVESLVGSAR
jgi:ParB family chromosome partitioning protein